MDRVADLNEPEDVPVELRGRTPRRVRMTWLGWANVFIATFFFVGGAAFGVNLVEQVAHYTTAQNALRRGGSDSSGSVTAKRWTAGKFGSPYVSYAFAVDGITYSGESKAPREAWDRLRQNDFLRVRYLLSNPNINHPADWEDLTPSDLWVLVVPMGMAAFSLLFARRIPLQRRLAVTGICARGSITDWHGPTRAGVLLDYTFRNANNGEVEIGSCRSDHSREVGSKVWVLYLPSDPNRSEIYPFNTDFFRIER
jgi:hypothetical protein